MDHDLLLAASTTGALLFQSGRRLAKPAPRAENLLIKYLLKVMCSVSFVLYGYGDEAPTPVFYICQQASFPQLVSWISPVGL